MADEDILWVQVSGERHVTDDEMKKIRSSIDDADLPYRCVLTTGGIETLTRDEVETLLENALNEIRTADA